MGWENDPVYGVDYKGRTPEEVAKGYMPVSVSDYQGGISQRAASFGIDYGQAIGQQFGVSDAIGRASNNQLIADAQYWADYERNAQARDKYQQAAADMMLARAQGKAPSVAEMQMRAGQDQALRDSMAMAVSSRTNPAAAQRAAIMAGNTMQAQTNQQAALLRAQEQAQAEQALLGAGTTMRASDLDAAGLANQRGIGQAGLAQADRQMLANLAAEANAGERGYAHQTSMNTYNNQQQWNRALLGGAFNMAGASMANLSTLSDERVKHNVKDGNDAAEAFMNALSAKGFSYKGENTPRLGVMAQDIEKTPEGDAMVTEPNGVKQFGNSDATSALLAAVANLNSRTRALEGKKGKR